MGEAEHGVDRPGADLRQFSATSWTQCSSSCASRDDCWAYTFERPSAAGQDGTCWLKEDATEPRQNNCCVSGIKVMGPFELGLDRPGGDMSPGFPSSPLSCRRACQLEPKCWAWTFVKPATQSEEGMCWLKGETPEARASDCCISGIRVVAPPVGPNAPTVEPTELQERQDKARSVKQLRQGVAKLRARQMKIRAAAATLSTLSRSERPTGLSLKDTKTWPQFIAFLRASHIRIVKTADGWQEKLDGFDKKLVEIAGGGETAQLMAATKEIQEMNMSFNQQYLQLQQNLQGKNRQFTMQSNIMKSKHDTAQHAINNVR